MVQLNRQNSFYHLYITTNKINSFLTTNFSYRDIMIVNLMVIAYFYYASEWNIISWVYLFNPSILKLASFELDCFLVSIEVNCCVHESCCVFDVLVIRTIVSISSIWFHDVDFQFTMYLFVLGELF